MKELSLQAHPNAAFTQEIPFVYHQNVKYDMKDANFEDLRCCLNLPKEQLEGVEGHALESFRSQRHIRHTII